MQKRFVFGREDRPGEEWSARFAVGREAARRWYLGDNRAARPSGESLDWLRGGGRGDPPTTDECRAALARHDRACALAGHDPLDHCVLSHYRPAEGRVDFIWPGHTVSRSFEHFETAEYVHDYRMLA